MQLFVFIAVLAAVSLLGVGYLGNDVELWIQQFGVGEDNIESPVTDAGLTIILDRINGYTLDGFTAIPSHKDLITLCEFTSQTEPLLAGTKLYCKLLDGMDIETSFIIATGFIELTEDVAAGVPIPIPIDMFSFENSHDADNVLNVIIEVIAPPGTT